MKKIEILFKIKSMDGGRISLQTRIRQVCAGKKLFLNNDGGTYQKLIRKNMGFERRPRAPVCDYTGSDLALFTGL